MHNDDSVIQLKESTHEQTVVKAVQKVEAKAEVHDFKVTPTKRGTTLTIVQDFPKKTAEKPPVAVEMVSVAAEEPKPVKKTIFLV